MYYSQLNPCDTANGDGVRVSLFVSGCSLNCPGCFNREAQNYRYGSEFTESDTGYIVHLLADPALAGLSILGGEPMAERNRGEVLKLCKAVKAARPDKTIWLWSGYTLELINWFLPEITQYIDVLIDGQYMEELANPELQWRGSSNQRVIYLRQNNTVGS